MAATSAPDKKARRPKRPQPPPSAVNIATSHRIKVRCLIRMAERATSPAMVGRELGIEASQVSYHVRVLDEFNLIEQVDERPVRGAVEHFFRTVGLAEVNEKQYEELPLELRKAWIETVFGLVGADAMYSIEMGILPKQIDCEITRTAMKVDEQGWEEIREAFIGVQKRVLDIRAESETRLALDEKLKPKPILAFNALFEMPPVKA